MSTIAEKKVIINVFCLGASLTAGYYDYGMRYHPYCTKLASLLNHNNETATTSVTVRYECDEYGVDGEDTLTMLLRLRDQFKVSRCNGESSSKGDNGVDDNSEQQQQQQIPLKYKDIYKSKKLPAQVARHNAEMLQDDNQTSLCLQDYTYGIIFGGTNDLGMNIQNTKIATNLRLMCQYLLKEAKMKTVFVITIPNCVADAHNEKYHARKLELNDMIIQLPCTDSNIVIIDLYQKLDYLQLDELERKRLWCDTLHFTPAGYDLLAEIIYNVMLPHMKQEQDAF